MKPSDPAELQPLLARLRQGDPEARDHIIAVVFERLRQLARKFLHVDFPRLEQLHGTGSVLNEGALRLWQVLEKEKPETERGLYALASQQMRRVLLDMARRKDRRPGSRSLDDTSEDGHGPHTSPADATDDPVRLAQWTEFHEAVAHLDGTEREVFEYRWYLDMTYEQIAGLLGVSKTTVLKAWVRACAKLPELPEQDAVPCEEDKCHDD